ncbi:MAG: hypothetical protein ACRDJN_09160, partial [Chloroflexota bacterium]
MTATNGAATAATGLTWPEANQRYLMASLGVVRCALERHAARRQGDAPSGEQERAARRAMQ